VKCPVIGCEKGISYGRSTCEMHYMRMRRHGDYFNTQKRTRTIEFSVTDNGCFEVTSHIPATNGYFHVINRGVRNLMHRHIYEECFGEITDGLFVLHRCDNKSCINPEHLELGTHEKNVQDAVDRGRYKIGSRHPNSKLSEDDVIKIRQMIQDGEQNIVVARMFNVDKDTVSDIKRRKSWKHVL
jgi:hypothetical protein